MNRKKQWIGASILLATFLIAIPVLTPRAIAGPVTKTCLGCGITILSPGSNGALNNQSTVGPTFLVSFAVKNFTLVQPGTHNDVNITNSQGIQEGHIHVFVDGNYYEIWTSSNGIPLTLNSGSHTIKLQLVSDFHLPFSPDITGSTTVTVGNGADTIQSTAMNAQNYSLGALIVSVIALILVAYVAFKPKPKTA
ncbi:hypothetical protein E6H19_02130 [Candidatus Bathyarchaeota archaeon]|nr:MAG: hypothetical protein E6H19_02130 [Candidatus Bathyarchaeota archaeon]